MQTLREARFATVVADIQKRWGNDAIKPLGDASFVGKASTLPTGFADLDARLHGGGLPLGQLTELHGAFASGVTTLTYCILAKGQAAGLAHPAAYIDIAQTFDAGYAARCGVNLSRLLVVRPDALKDAFEIAAELIVRYGATLLIMDMSFETAAAARQAASSPAFRRLTALVRGTACAVVCLTRPQTGMTSPIRAYVALCLHLQHARWIRQYGDVAGCETQATIVRQKQGGGGQARLKLLFEPVGRGSI